VSEYLEELFHEFDLSARKASNEGDKYIIIDRVYENFDDLSAFPFKEVLGKILELIERYPALDYGGPGPFGSFIEEHPTSEYAHELLDSLYRQPSTQVLGWLDRTMSDNDFQDDNAASPEVKQKYKACLLSVMSNPKTTSDCKDFASICVKDL
jgi:hypothetical protein